MLQVLVFALGVEPYRTQNCCCADMIQFEGSRFLPCSLKNVGSARCSLRPHAEGASYATRNAKGGRDVAKEMLKRAHLPA